jgi:glucose-6-phosphate isomerase
VSRNSRGKSNKGKSETFNFNNKVLVSKNLYTSKCAAAFLHAVSD